MYFRVETLLSRPWIRDFMEDCHEGVTLVVAKAVVFCVTRFVDHRADATFLRVFPCDALAVNQGL